MEALVERGVDYGACDSAKAAQVLHGAWAAAALLEEVRSHRHLHVTAMHAEPTVNCWYSGHLCRGWHGYGSNAARPGRVCRQAGRRWGHRTTRQTPMPPCFRFLCLVCLPVAQVLQRELDAGHQVVKAQVLQACVRLLAASGAALSTAMDPTSQAGCMAADVSLAGLTYLQVCAPGSAAAGGAGPARRWRYTSP